MEGMDHIGKGKAGKKGLIQKTWNRCRSLHVGGKRPSPLEKSKSWPNGLGFGIKINIDGGGGGGGGGGEDDKLKSRCKVAPEGCFTVYVGPEKERFVIKTQYANHPLFKLLLEEAELEYGYNSEGPLVLPCNVGMFYKVISEMEMEDSDELRQGCNFTKGYGSYRLLSPARMVAMK